MLRILVLYKSSMTVSTNGYLRIIDAVNKKLPSVLFRKTKKYLKPHLIIKKSIPQEFHLNSFF